MSLESDRGSAREWSAQEAFHIINPGWDRTPALLANGQGGDAEKVRFGFLPLTPGRPHMLWNGYLTEFEAIALRAMLAAKGQVLSGGFDFMYATPWRVAWAASPEYLSIYSPRGVRTKVYADRVEVQRPGAGIRRIPRDAIAEVRGETGLFHAMTRVRARLKGGDQVSLITSYNVRAVFSDENRGVYEQWPHRVADAVKTHLDIAT
ncbi:MAG: hypothetical protein AB7O24_30575 [Kofleriaceae bacterium]